MAAMSRPRFHLAFPVRDLTEARAFYGTLLGCLEGRSSDEWVDFDFFGHQIVAHLSRATPATKDIILLTATKFRCGISA
ncbi:MAG TPA: hypothetical protein VHU87_04975 [Rhizomicrobium sp.]|nr:hypothetical protein [Rhizomicrobium sp.]